MFALKSDVVRTETDYGSVLLNMTKGSYWDLNPTAALIVEVLVDKGSVADAAAAVAREYDVELDTARLDVESLIAELCAAQLATA